VLSVNSEYPNTLSLDIDKFLNQINYSSFYQRHIDNFKQNGKQSSCHCPFHEDKHKSFSVNLETGLWNCFAGCGAGNAIQFVQKRYDLDFKSSVEKIAAEERIDNPLEKSRNGDTAKKKQTRKVSYLTSNQIETIHQQLINNKSLLKQFQDKYGLSLETIKKYRIGYKDGKYAIPIENSPGKWQIKLHKGHQTKGAKASIYPPDIIKEDMPFIVLTEGEFKALLLIQLGFMAVTNTAGALTWKHEWNTTFRGLNVFLAYDNDDSGKKGSKKVAGSLNGTAKSVKVIHWPSYMNGKDKKDVTDFFVTLKKTKEDFQKLLDNAKETGYETKEIDGITFIEPDDYLVEEQCVKHVTLFKDNVIEKVIFHSPVLITSRAIDIDLGTEDSEIAFRRDWKWKKLWVNRKTLCDSRKIIDLSEQGLSVNSSNSRKMVEYLCAFENSNMPVIKRSYVTKGLGWKTISDKKIFLLHKDETQSKSDNDINFIPEIGFERYVKALKKEGSFEKWKAVVEEAIQYPLTNFAFYASFAAPLLNIVKAPNFIIDFWGTTSLGKTSVLELASSVWGNPHKESGGLVFSWDSTRVYLERMANFFCDIPIFPDDSQQVDDRTLTKILYMVANGVGRGRGSTTGVRQTARWQTVCFSTGEKPLTECTTFAGARARTIEFHGSPFTTKVGSFVNRLKHVIRENYGHAGQMFINHLVSLVSNPDEVEKLKADYRKAQSELAEFAQTEVGDRYSHYFAVIDLAARLANEVLGINNPDANKKIFYVFMDFIGESAHETDMAGRAMRHVLSWASGNERFFKNSDYESYGVWVEGEYIAIYPHKLTEVLRKEGFSEKSVLKEWANRNWIKRHDNKHFSIVVAINYANEIKRRRVISIPWNIVEKHFE
jgi:putative DNA primase/helicase